MFRSLHVGAEGVRSKVNRDNRCGWALSPLSSYFPTNSAHFASNHFVADVIIVTIVMIDTHQHRGISTSIRLLWNHLPMTSQLCIAIHTYLPIFINMLTNAMLPPSSYSMNEWMICVSVVSWLAPRQDGCAASNIKFNIYPPGSKIHRKKQVHAIKQMVIHFTK